MRRNVIVQTALFLGLLAAIFLPGVKETKPQVVFVAVILAVEGICVFRIRRNIRPRATTDICTLVFGLLFVWELLTKHLNRTNPVLIPPPENVFYVFYSHGGMMLEGVWSSMELLLIGFGASLFFGVSLGLIIGWIPRLREMLYPIAKVLAPVPSVIYTPYIIALMPTFRSASAMVIVLGLFFPTLMQIIASVHTLDRRIINSARAMNVSNTTMIFYVLLPYVVPGVISGLRVSLSTSFMILTIAEMMGATSGLGYFIKNYADFANYTNVIAGIILVGVVVTLLNRVVTLLENRFIKWRVS